MCPLVIPRSLVSDGTLVIPRSFVPDETLVIPRSFVPDETLVIPRSFVPDGTLVIPRSFVPDGTLVIPRSFVPDGRRGIRNPGRSLGPRPVEALGMTKTNCPVGRRLLPRRRSARAERAVRLVQGVRTAR
jgi:hypothetical protein